MQVSSFLLQRVCQLCTGNIVDTSGLRDGLGQAEKDRWDMHGLCHGDYTLYKCVPIYMLAIEHDVSDTEILMGVVVLYVFMVLGRACIVYFSNFRVVVFVKDAIFTTR